MVITRADYVFILVRHFLSKSFAAVREAFSSAYPDREVAYRIRQQYTDWQKNVGTQEVFVCDKCSSSDETSNIKELPKISYGFIV
jgi:hypothetical protein